jgi:hypothetical protein
MAIADRLYRLLNMEGYSKQTEKALADFHAFKNKEGK